MEQSELEWIRQHLPEKPTKGMLDWQDLFYKGELGGEYLVFHGERVRTQPRLEDLYENRTRGKSVWAAECTCTECGEAFPTAGAGRKAQEDCTRRPR